MGDERRDALEESLLRAGFVLPLHDAASLVPRSADATGISFAIILGRALVAGPTPSKRDQARPAVTAELNERAKREGRAGRGCAAARSPNEPKAVIE
jgi:hypothetical protein